MDTTDSAERIDKLEAAVSDLSDQVAALRSAMHPHGTPPTTSSDDPSDPPAAQARQTATFAASVPASALPEQLWALRGVHENIPAPGGVVYAGSVDVGLGHVEYQWGRPITELLRADWAERAEPLSALGHPLRLSILRLLLDGEHTVAQLVDELDLASTGVAYHHLNLLQGAGWAASPQRGSWTIPVAKIIPLLSILTAVENS